MEAIQVFFDPRDLSLVFDKQGNLIEEEYTKFFGVASKNIEGKLDTDRAGISVKRTSKTAPSKS